jgi:hypothetical protein
MHVVIHHQISDPMKWERSEKNIMAMIEQHRLPAGLKPLEYLPGVDGRKADCVWETESLGTLQKFTERETNGARSEYFEVKEESAIGLPKAEELVRGVSRRFRRPAQAEGVLPGPGLALEVLRG